MARGTLAEQAEAEQAARRAVAALEEGKQRARVDAGRGRGE
jgi:hypothetical protein